MQERSSKFLKVDSVVVKALKWISFISAVAMTVVAVIATVDVVMAKVFGSGLKNATEIIEYLLIPIVYCSCSYLCVSQGLINVDLLLAKFPRWAHIAVNALSDLMGAACSFLLARWGYNRFAALIVSGEKSSTSSYAFRLWPFGLCFFVGMVLLCFAMLWRFVRDFAAPELNMPPTAAEVEAAITAAEKEGEEII